MVNLLIQKLNDMGEKLYYFIILDEAVNHKHLLEQVTDLKQLLQMTRTRLKELWKNFWQIYLSLDGRNCN